ncbi:MAG: YdcF family protein [Opitutales bacterium]|jgi:uncharacterized SAM-binding protein YcdF (DUF218 family)
MTEQSSAKSRRWLYPLAGFALLVILGWLFRVPLLTGYANWFIKDNATQGADAILVLSGGGITRVPKGLELLEEGYAPLICLTDEKKRNAKYQHLMVSHLELAQQVARENDSNASFTLIPSLSDGATSTFDEAADALVFAKKHGWKRLIIVTDGFHTRRALFAFEKVFEGSGVQMEVAAVSNDIFGAENWWKSDRGISAFVLETIKFPVYFFWSEEPEIVRND